MPVRLLNLQEAADSFQLDPGELRRLAVCGEIPCIEQGVRLLFDYEELDTWFTTRMLRRQLKRPPKSEEVALSSYCRLETMEPALAGKTRAAILKNLAALAERSGLLYDPAEFLEELRKREDAASTAMPEGIALVHPQRRDEYTCEAPFVAIARAAQPSFFGEPDGGLTDLFFVVCSPDSKEHLALLAHICTLIATTPLLERLRAAETAEEMLAAVHECAPAPQEAQ